MLGRGDTYAEVSVWVQSRVRKGGVSPEKRNAWRRAADVVEVFAPVVWQDWLNGVLAADAQRDERGREAPRVVLLDDLPVYRKATRHGTQGQRFVVIAAAEAVPAGTTRPGSGRPARSTQLRLLRALPTRSSDAYTLVLDDLVQVFGFVPDIIVGDGGKGIKPAVDALAARARRDVLFVTSAFHLRTQLGRALDKASKVKPDFDPGSLADDLAHDRPFADRSSFEAWWNAYERRLQAQGVPRSGWPNKWKHDYYDGVITQLDALAPFPDVPRSTGALEALLTRHVKPPIKRRAQGLGNLARTQQLLDLFVLNAAGYFHDLGPAVAALRTDATEGDNKAPGFVPPVRTLSDPGLYRSLLDADLIDQLLAARGL